jgi:hypothetical protein
LITGFPEIDVDRKMKNKILENLKDMYLMPFRAIASGMKLFTRNRDRVRDFISQPGIAKTLRYAMLLTLFIWLAIALFTKDEGNNRLTEAINELWSTTKGDSSQTDSTTVNKHAE